MSAGSLRITFSKAARLWLDLLTGDILAAIYRGYVGDAAGKRVHASILGIPFLDFTETKAKKTYDDRVRRLDDAREALSESLQAIDELAADAEKARSEYAQVVEALKVATESKQDAERTLAHIRAITNNDVGAFQLLAGVPNVRRERLIGFISGIVASTLVTVAFWFAQRHGWFA